MKLLAFSAAGLVLIAVILAVGLHFWLDEAIERAVEELAPKMTSSAVTLDDVDTSLLFGTAQVEGLAVGNPAGYNAPHAVVVRKARVRLDWQSVRTDTLVIDEIVIDGPELTFEGLLGKNNLNALKDNVQAYAGAAQPNSAESSRTKTTERKVMVRNFRLTNGRVNLWVGGAKTATIPLPDIHLTDLGKQSGGTSVKELTATITAAIYGAIVRAVGNAGAVLDKGVEVLGGAGKQLSDSAEKAASQTFGGLKGILGGK